MNTAKEPQVDLNNEKTIVSKVKTIYEIIEDITFHQNELSCVLEKIGNYDKIKEKEQELEKTRQDNLTDALETIIEKLDYIRRDNLNQYNFLNSCF